MVSIAVITVTLLFQHVTHLHNARLLATLTRPHDKMAKSFCYVERTLFFAARANNIVWTSNNDTIVAIHKILFIYMFICLQLLMKPWEMKHDYGGGFYILIVLITTD